MTTRRLHALPTTSSRKDEQLTAALNNGVLGASTTGFERWRMRHRALPGIDLDGVDLATTIFGRPVRAPLFISSMTGGSASTALVNRRLAAAAERAGVAFALGSMRAALEQPALRSTYAVRAVASTVPVLGNIGTRHVDVRGLRRLCASLELDALVVHLNPLHEAVQRGGDVRFAGALACIRRIVDTVGLPVVVKEVGFGLAPDDIELLLGAGVAAVDVAGAGGTNWALVEGHRDARVRRLAAAFADWGWPTADAVVAGVEARRRLAPNALVFASGGVRDGVDAAKALCLGADAVGLARALLEPAVVSDDSTAAAVDTVVEQLRIAAFASGCARVEDFGADRLVERA